jgi:hypothetical protein
MDNTYRRLRLAVEFVGEVTADTASFRHDGLFFPNLGMVLFNFWPLVLHSIWLLIDLCSIRSSPFIHVTRAYANLWKIHWAVPYPRDDVHRWLSSLMREMSRNVRVGVVTDHRE